MQAEGNWTLEKMKILFDGQIFATQEFGGISRYYHELAGALGSLGGVKVDIMAPLYINNYLRTGAGYELHGWKAPKIKRATGILNRVNCMFTGLAVPACDPDIFHETYYSAQALPLRRARRVITVLDMIHERFPQHFASADRTSDLKKVSVARADHILCISECTRRDLIDILRVPKEKTSVVYLGHSFAAERLAPGAVRAAPQERPFILYVGPRGGYKDFGTLLRAFASRERIYRAFHLVCAGGGEFGTAEQEMIQRLPEGTVTQVFADDALLADLYENAAVFVYSSLYEGFGIPPLEAMSHGCPVITTRGGSLPEVVGDAAEIFDAGSGEALAWALERVLFSESRRAELKSRGFQRVKRFTWATCATQTLNVYKSLI